MHRAEKEEPSAATGPGAVAKEREEEREHAVGVPVGVSSSRGRARQRAADPDSKRHAPAAALSPGQGSASMPMVSGAPNFFGPADYMLPDGVSITQVAKHAGAELLGATAYLLEPGSRWADLHVHHANEEMIVVLEGSPTLHTLHQSRKLQTGDVVACLRGRRGAHRLTNDSDSAARVLIVSTMNMPEIVEYPEEGEDGRVLAMTEPPWSEAAYDDAKGRLIRVFRRSQGQAIPPDAAPE